MTKLFLLTLITLLISGVCFAQTSDSVRLDTTSLTGSGVILHIDEPDTWYCPSQTGGTGSYSSSGTITVTFNSRYYGVSATSAPTATGSVLVTVLEDAAISGVNHLPGGSAAASATINNVTNSDSVGVGSFNSDQTDEVDDTIQGASLTYSSTDGINRLATSQVLSTSMSSSASCNGSKIALSAGGSFLELTDPELTDDTITVTPHN